MVIVVFVGEELVEELTKSLEKDWGEMFEDSYSYVIWYYIYFVLKGNNSIYIYLYSVYYYVEKVLSFLYM